MAREDIGAREFFRALYQGVGAGFLEIRPLPEGDAPEVPREFFRWESELDQALSLCDRLSGKYHVFFGVGLRSKKKPDKPGEKIGGKANVGCVTAVFADFDFKDVPEADLREKLKAFPLKPSIVVHSGHGIHAYWLLDYPAVGAARDRLQAVNLAVLRHFGAQRGVQDYSRILRVPGTPNIKGSYPDPKPVTHVTYFYPDRKYKLEEFEALEALATEDNLSQPARSGTVQGAPPPGSKALPSPASPPPPSGGEPNEMYRPRPAPHYALPEQTVEKVALAFSEIWIPHQRHAMALRSAGMLAHAGVSLGTALDIIRRASDAVGGETEKRLKDVRDTYDRFCRGEEVVGAPDLERMIKEEFPSIAQEQALKTLSRIRGFLPSLEKGKDGAKKRKFVDPDFEVVSIEKFNSKPPLYTVHIKRLSEPDVHIIGQCEHKVYHTYYLFRAYFNEVTDLFIANIDQWQWEQMREKAKKEGRLESKEAPEEASADGQMSEVLDSFLEEVKEHPADGELKAFPGYDGQRTYFTLRAYKSRLKEANLRNIADRELTHFLRRHGWSDDRRRISGSRAYRYWWKATNGYSVQESKATPSEELFGGGS